MEEKIIYSIEFEGSDALLAEIAKIRKENDALKQDNRELSTEMKKNSTIVDEQAVSYERNTIKIKDNTAKINILSTKVRENSSEHKNLRTQLRVVREEMTQLALAGQTNTKMYTDLRNKAASYQEAIDDVNAEIRTFADSERVFTTVAEGTQVLTSGFQVLTSVQSILGFESENFQKTMVTLVAAMNIANGVHEISNKLTKEGAVRTALASAGKKVAAVAQGIWTAAMKKGVVTMTLLTGGLTLIVAGVALLTKHLITNRDKNEEVNDVMNEGNSVMEQYEANLKKINDAQAQRSADLDHTIKLMRARGASEVEILKLEREGIQANIDAINEKARIAGETAKQQALSLNQGEKFANQAQKQVEHSRRLAEGYDEEKRKLEILDARLQTLHNNNSQRRTTELEETRAKNEETRRLETQQIYDKLNRAELAEAEMLVLLNNSLENQIILETVKHNQLLESRNDWTKEEIELMNLQHDLKLQSLKDYYLNKNLVEETEAIANKTKEEEEWINWLETTEHQNLTEVEKLNKKMLALENAYNKDLISYETYTNAKKELNKQIEGSNNKLMLSQLETFRQVSGAVIGALGAIGEAFIEGGKESRAFAMFSKSLAIAETMINITTGIAASSKIGFPQNIIAIAGYVAQTAGLISKIKNTKIPDKYAKGGIIGGNSHAMGGTKYYGEDGNVFEAERGEYFAIINKHDAQRAMALDMINQEHGVSLNTSGNYFARGGSVMPNPRGDFSGINMNDVVRDIVDKMISIPVINDVRQTRDMIRRVENIEKYGNL